MAQLTDQIEVLIQPILDDLGLELVAIEYQRETRGWVLRFFLDKNGGINLDNCAEASREISAILDVENVIETAYSLEVSSPGINRPLTKAENYIQFAGRLAKIKTFIALDPDGRGQNRKTFIGVIGGVDGTDVLLTTKEKRAVQIKIALDQIEKANLEFEF